MTKTYAPSILWVTSLLTLTLKSSCGFQPSTLQIYHLGQFRSKLIIQSTLSSRVEGLEQSQHGPSHDVNISVVSKNDKKMHTSEMIKQPVGSLNIHHIKSLCYSIRHVDSRFVYKSLGVLERILLELNALGNNTACQDRTTPILKPMHVFSVLTAISKDMRKNKQKPKFGTKITRNNPTLNARGIQQIQNVVHLLKQLVSEEKSVYIDRGCYNEDVLSFAVMITADAGRCDLKGVDASLGLLRLIEVEGNTGEWDPRLVGAVLNSLASWGRASEAQTLLEDTVGVKMTDTNFNSSNERTSKRKLDPAKAEPCYNALLRAWSKRATLLSQKNHTTAMAKAETALTKGTYILLHHMPNVTGLSITNQTYVAALQGYGSLGLGKAAEELLAKIEMHHHSKSKSLLVQNSTLSNLDQACYNSVLAALCQSKQDDGIACAEKLLHSMINQHPTSLFPSNGHHIDIIPPRPDYISYSTLLNTYSKRGMIDEAESLLKSMVSASLSDTAAPIPSASSYLTVMQAMIRSNTKEAPERVLSLVNEMEQLYHENAWSSDKSNKRKQPSPTRAIYITALKYMSKLGRAIEAEQLFKKLRQIHHAIDMQSTTLVLRAWGWTDQVNREEAAMRAEVLLRDLESYVDEGPIKPLDVNVYNIVLNCYAKAGLFQKAKDLLEKMKPNENGISYGLVIKAISKSNRGDAVDLAWEVLSQLGYPSPSQSDKLSSIFDDSIDPFNSMLRLLAKRGLASEAESLLDYMDEMYYDRKLMLRPNVSSYEAVLEALGRCKDSDSATRAEALLTRMDVLNELGGSMQPSLVAYNHLINCYANAGMSGRAERLIDRLKKNEVDSVKPDEFTVGSTIKAIINGGKSQDNALTRVSSLVEDSIGSGGMDNNIISAHRLNLYTKFGMGHEAETLLRQMKTPGIIHYTIVLNAWAKSDADDASDRAEALLREIERNPELDLDITAYNAMMMNYSMRGNVEKAEKMMEELLSHSSILVNRKTFTMLIRAYDKASKKPENSAKRAEELLDKMRELHAAGNNDAEPDDVTYRAIIKLIRNGEVQGINDHEVLALMSRLQLERWPFDKEY